MLVNGAVLEADGNLLFLMFFLSLFKALKGRKLCENVTFPRYHRAASSN